MKTIIMRDPYPESPGSRFPLVRVTALEAEALAQYDGARLPTSQEYDRLFAIDPWPHSIWEWTSDSDDSYRVLRGGARDYDARGVRVADRNAVHPGFRNAGIGFRLARDVPDDAPVPDGWVAL